MSAHPDDAEAIPIGPYWEAGLVPSELLPGLMQAKPKITCPDCKHKHPATTKAITCKCGLSFEMDIGVLHVWREEPTSA